MSNTERTKHDKNSTLNNSSSFMERGISDVICPGRRLKLLLLKMSETGNMVDYYTFIYVTVLKSHENSSLCIPLLNKNYQYA